MKRWLGLIALILMLAVPSVVIAQTGTPVSIAPTPLITVQPYVTATAADEGAVNKQLTVTITPPAGQYFYLVAYEIGVMQNATSTAVTNGLFTQTGFTNLPITGLSLPATANLNGNDIFYSFPIPVKSKTAGAAVTFVSPAALTNAAFTYHVWGYTAP